MTHVRVYVVHCSVSGYPPFTVPCPGIRRSLFSVRVSAVHCPVSGYTSFTVQCPGIRRSLSRVRVYVVHCSVSGYPPFTVPCPGICRSLPNVRISVVHCSVSGYPPFTVPHLSFTVRVRCTWSGSPSVPPGTSVPLPRHQCPSATGKSRLTRPNRPWGVSGQAAPGRPPSRLIETTGRPITNAMSYDPPRLRV